jgi:molybdopterin-guanine dinucleotide biosynthesis protein A
VREARAASSAVDAAILAGGESRRMGRDKALLRLTPDGPTLIEMVVARLREAGFSHPLIVANQPVRFDFLGLRTVPDEFVGVGPLAGILSALENSTTSRVLVVACDMPHLMPTLLRFMLSPPNDADVTIPRWHDVTGTEQIEPFHAFYSRDCIGPIRRRIGAGQFKVSDLLHDVSVHYVEEAALRALDPKLLSFFNVNSPADLAKLPM